MDLIQYRQATALMGALICMVIPLVGGLLLLDPVPPAPRPAIADLDDERLLAMLVAHRAALRDTDR